MKKQKLDAHNAIVPDPVYPEEGNNFSLFHAGVYPVFDDDLPRDNMENNITALNLEGVWPDSIERQPPQ